MWFIYALGGGYGHLTRAAALARVANATQHVRILTNSPYAATVQATLPELEIVVLEEGGGIAVRHIESARPDCLIVDTFPRGLVGELVDILASFPGRKVLIQRDLTPQYIAAFDLNRFVRNSYDLVLIAGETTADGLAICAQAVITPPWLVRSSDEILPCTRARDLLRLVDPKPCVLVCAAGNSNERAWYGAVVSTLLASSSCHVRCIAPECPDGCPRDNWLNYWPAMDLYPAADAIVGGGGYNTVQECIALNILLIARPWPRKYDRQALRASHAIVVSEPEDAACAALRVISNAPPREAHTPYPNGAVEAVALIAQACAKVSW